MSHVRRPVHQVFAGAALIGAARKFYDNWNLDCADARTSEFLLEVHAIQSDATNGGCFDCAALLFFSSSSAHDSVAARQLASFSIACCWQGASRASELGQVFYHWQTRAEASIT
jgi:hypothetical protein